MTIFMEHLHAQQVSHRICFIVLKTELLSACMYLLGTAMVTVSVGSPGKEQLSVLPSSAGRLPLVTNQLKVFQMSF